MTLRSILTPTREFSSRLFGNRSDIIGTFVGIVMTGSLLLPVAIQQSAQQAEHEAAQVKATTQLSESTGLHHEQLKVYADQVQQRIDDAAATALAQGKTVAEQAKAKTDVTALTNAIAALSDYDSLSQRTVLRRTDAVKTVIQTTSAAAAEADRVAAAQAAAALAAANTPDGARTTARSLAASTYGWGDDQFQCLSNLWQKESGWSYTASNGSSGAAGIPQALPGSKMATAGADWASNATTQIKWGLDYIARGYGTPCSAWSHSQSMNWY
ncbi:aggregation-promoting factor C-terminal-like domain-containing protein [Rathayibacter soli]|uniref:aggregation-promoting factor C-terminal-like domain-containing protein n=1 Tax=Rathayibacter soli TaxID=3144168 RepID=UPI0027E58AC4|nr:hypothetical protein [Glaciibacter superstes]